MRRFGYVLTGLVCSILLLGSVASAQLAFESATIKQQQPQTLRLAGGSCHGTDTTYPPNTALVPPLGRCVVTFSLSSLVGLAYSPPAPVGGVSRITGGPDWVDSDFWLVEGKAEDPASTKELELKEMLQELLVERFKLRFHHETREVSGYALVVAKDGLKFDEDHSENTNEPVMSSTRSGLVYRKAPLSMFASFLSGRAGAPVIDKTGLPGPFSFTFNPPPPQSAADSRDAAGAPSIFTAIQEQLGLRLESSRIPADFLVIDHVERPTPN